MQNKNTITPKLNITINEPVITDFDDGSYNIEIKGVKSQIQIIKALQYVYHKFFNEYFVNYKNSQLQDKALDLINMIEQLELLKMHDMVNSSIIIQLCEKLKVPAYCNEHIHNITTRPEFANMKCKCNSTHLYYNLYLKEKKKIGLVSAQMNRLLEKIHSPLPILKEEPKPTANSSHKYKELLCKYNLLKQQEERVQKENNDLKNQIRSIEEKNEKLNKKIQNLNDRLSLFIEEGIKQETKVQSMQSKIIRLQDKLKSQYQQIKMIVNPTKNEQKKESQECEKTRELNPNSELAQQFYIFSSSFNHLFAMYDALRHSNDIPILECRLLDVNVSLEQENRIYLLFKQIEQINNQFNKMFE